MKFVLQPKITLSDFIFIIALFLALACGFVLRGCVDELTINNETKIEQTYNQKIKGKNNTMQNDNKSDNEISKSDTIKKEKKKFLFW